MTSLLSKDVWDAVRSHYEGTVIRQDPTLADEQKLALLSVYRSFADEDEQ